MGIETIVAVGGALLGAGVSYMQGEKQAKEMKKANAVAQEAATKQATMAEQDMNKRNAKQPDTASLLFGNKAAGMAGPSSTSLTGPAGIDPSTLSLGKNTLLGM